MNTLACPPARLQGLFRLSSFVYVLCCPSIQCISFISYLQRHQYPHFIVYVSHWIFYFCRTMAPGVQVSPDTVRTIHRMRKDGMKLTEISSLVRLSSSWLSRLLRTTDSEGGDKKVAKNYWVFPEWTIFVQSKFLFIRLLLFFHCDFFVTSFFDVVFLLSPFLGAYLLRGLCCLAYFVKLCYSCWFY